MISLIALMLLNVSVMAQNTPPKREFRGAWIQAINGQFKGKSAAEMQQMLTQQLDALQAAGINAIIFQVRPEADALYVSSIEPWSRYLTGVQGQAPNPFWDPMAWMIEQCHQRNMEFHAWINPYRAKTQASAQTEQRQLTIDVKDLGIEISPTLSGIFFGLACALCAVHNKICQRKGVESA